MFGFPPRSSRILLPGILVFTNRIIARSYLSSALTNSADAFLATRWSLMGQCYLTSIVKARAMWELHLPYMVRVVWRISR